MRFVKRFSKCDMTVGNVGRKCGKLWDLYLFLDFSIIMLIIFVCAFWSGNDFLLFALITEKLLD